MDHRSRLRSTSVDHTQGGRLTGFDVGTTDVRAWLALWPRVLSQLDNLVVGLKRRYGVICDVAHHMLWGFRLPQVMPKLVFVEWMTHVFRRYYRRADAAGAVAKGAQRSRPRC